MSRRRQQRRAEKERRHTQPPAIVGEATRVERLAYTRTQAAEALGISRSTFRRLLPYLETIEMPWGTKLIPVDELERVITERRQETRKAARPVARPGRKQAVPREVVERIRLAKSAGKSLAQIAADLDADRIPTAHGGRKWWPSTVRSVLSPPGRAAPAAAKARSN
jgi:Recombinase